VTKYTLRVYLLNRTDLIRSINHMLRDWT